MEVICECGKKMDLKSCDPGCDSENPSNFVLFECSCGASLSGEHRLAADGDDDEQEPDN